MFIIVDNGLSDSVVNMYNFYIMNAFEALMNVFLFSVVGKMSHSEIHFPCPVPCPSPQQHYSDVSVMMGTKLCSVTRISVIPSDSDNLGGAWSVITSGK